MLEEYEEDEEPPYFKLDEETYRWLVKEWTGRDKIMAKYDGERLLGFELEDGSWKLIGD